MLTTEYAPVKQSGNGVAVAFDFTFKILAATDLVVTKTDANGNTTACVLGVDYTVAFDPIAESGTVTYTVPPVNGGFSNIARVSDDQQQSSLPREGVMPAKTVETMIDKSMMLIQELEARQLATASAQVGTTAQLNAIVAANPTTPFLAIITDTRTIQVYLGNTALGQNGWAFVGGF